MCGSARLAWRIVWVFVALVAGVSCDDDRRSLAPTDVTADVAPPLPPDAPVIYLHFDYMVGLDHSHAPDPESIQMVVDAFQRQGIILHIDPLHAAIPERVIDMTPLRICIIGYQHPEYVGFYDLKAQYFHPSGMQPWHYAIFAHDAVTYYEDFYPCLPLGKTGFAELPGYNFVVSLGHFFFDQEACAGAHYLTAERCHRAEGGTFMHELGHNFDLWHGGRADNYIVPGRPPLSMRDGTTFKPNYLSVMNYKFQLIGVLTAPSPGDTVYAHARHRLDYQGVILPTLDEHHLDERVGLGGPPDDADLSTYDALVPLPGTDGQWPNVRGCPFVVVPATGPIDWNCNGVIEADVQAELNLQSDPIFCPCYSILWGGFNDWAWVQSWLNTPTYQFGRVRPTTIVADNPPEPTPEGPKTFERKNRAEEPVVIAVSPNSGLATGGTPVTITGTHLGKATDVVFGAAGHASFTIVSNETIVAVAPPADPACYTTHITVVSGTNPSPHTDADRFTYTNVLPLITGVSPSSGLGGTAITVTGSNFTGTQQVRFYASSYQNYGSPGFTLVDDHAIVVNSPESLVGAYHILVYNAYGSNVGSLGTVDVFTFTPPPPPPAAPTVTSVSPTSGPASGGTTITIQGAGFSAATAVTVGPYGVASYTIVNDNTITAVTNPAGAAGPGTFNVTVANAGGTSPVVASDQFTYY